MSSVLQRLQRRAVVALAWLVLALAVVPAAGEAFRPLVVCAAASSLSMAAGAPAARGPARGGAVTRPVEAVARTRRAPPAIERASAALPAAALLAAALPAAALAAPPHANRRAARDGRRLYLSICRLSC